MYEKLNIRIGKLMGLCGVLSEELWNNVGIDIGLSLFGFQDPRVVNTGRHNDWISTTLLISDISRTCY